MLPEERTFAEDDSFRPGLSFTQKAESRRSREMREQLGCCEDIQRVEKEESKKRSLSYETLSSVTLPIYIMSFSSPSLFFIS